MGLRCHCYQLTGGVFILPLPCPFREGKINMLRRRTLHLPALLWTLAAAGLVACAVALSAVSGEANAAFPNKNSRIAYNSQGVIYTINPDGSGKSKVTDTGVSGYPIDYSPDGKKITYTSYEGFNDGNPTGPQKDTEIYTIKVGGDAKTNVTDNNRGDEDSSYSPDGKRIAYAHWDGHDFEIYTINTDGTGEFRVTNNRRNEFDPSYSPDGKKIVFSGEKRSLFPFSTYAVEIYTIGVHAKNRVRLTHNSTYDYFADYSPDGSRIAFAGTGDKGTNIYTISARGGDKTKVTGGDDPDYSPDSKKISYYTDNEPHGEVYTIHVGDGGKTKVTEGSNPSWGSRP
jgi:TolB protein